MKIMEGSKLVGAISGALISYIIRKIIIRFCVELSSTLEQSEPFDQLYCMTEINYIKTSLCLYK
jgi:hypothetical protein